MGANTHNNYFSLRGGGAETDTAPLTSAGSLDFFNNVGRLYHADRKIYSRVSKPDCRVAKRIDTTPEINYNSNIMNYKSDNKTLSKAHSKHKPHATHAKRVAFTLAEVLITLAIIGIVAAMTIPTLIANYQERAWNTSASVFERKLEEALKQMNTQQVLAGYKSTADFVGALGKYFKINKVCQNDDIMSCFENKVYWGADEEEVDMTKIKNAKNFGQDDWNTELIGVQFANGTTGIIAYNPECKENPYTNQFTGTSCLAILYDTTGFKTPNTQQKDLRGINIISLGGSNCAIELSDGTCFTAPIITFDPLSHDECIARQSELGIKNCRSGDNDYWGGAVKACGGVTKMPTQAQLTALAEEIYGTSINSSGSTSGLSWNKDKLEEMGFDTSSGSVRVWSGEEYIYNTVASSRGFYPTYTDWDGSYLRSYITLQAVCIAD